MDKQVVVIGAGPAGLAAGMQLSRSGVDVLLYEKKRVGGLLWNANLVENYPGFPRGVRGPKLVRLMEQQAQNLGVRICLEEVKALFYHHGLFRLESENSDCRAQIVVLATGTRPRRLPMVEALQGTPQRTYYEVAPLLEVRGCRVAVVGAGDAAFDYALNLARHNQVVIFNRSRRTRCLPLLQQRAAVQPAISYHDETRVTQVLHLGEALQVTTQSPAGSQTESYDYLLAAIGREPEQSVMQTILKEETQALEGEGLLYRIGDLCSGITRQTAIAVGQGLRAAMQIQRKLEDLA